MSVQLETVETADSVIIKVHRSPVWWESLISGASIGAFAFLLLTRSFEVRTDSALAIAAVASITTAALRHKQSNVTTTVTKFETHTVGSFGNGYEPNRNVPLSNIHYFQFQESDNSENPPPRGLYAVTDHRSTCIVPFISPVQAEPIIDLLEKRFSHVLASYTTSSSRSSGDLIQLHLNRP